MASIPPIALIAGAAAAFMLFSRKKAEPNSEPPSPEEEIPSVGGGDAPPVAKPVIPPVKSQEELKKEYDEQAAASLKEVRDGLQWKKIPPGRDIPEEMLQNQIWASEDCEVAAIGGDWGPVIEFDGKLYDPASYWKEFGDNNRPNKVLEEVGGKSHVRWFTDELMRNGNADIECETEVPNKKDYENGVDFDNAWTAYLNSAGAFAYLYDEILRRHVKEPMMSVWFDADPDAYMAYQIVVMADWAVLTFPSEDVTEQTDKAYASWIHTFEGFEDAPAKLDPDDPDHEELIALWFLLNEEIKSL